MPVYANIQGKLTCYAGGGETLELELVQSDIEWNEEGDTYSEAMVRNEHPKGEPPILVRTGHGNVAGSATLLVKRFTSPSGSYSPYEWFTHSGRATSLRSTSQGDKWAFGMKYYIDSSVAGGQAETVNFRYCAVKLKVAPSAADGKMLLSFDFTDHELQPQVVEGAL